MGSDWTVKRSQPREPKYEKDLKAEELTMVMTDNNRESEMEGKLHG